jgi:anti-sigma regulatory factor (Ser/Thr protein kinase)
VSCADVGGTDKPVAFEFRFEPDPARVATVRRRLGNWLASTGVDGETGFELVVVASELATNAILHDGGDDVTVRAQRTDDAVELAVHSVDMRERLPPVVREAEPLVETGRGLHIVSRLTDACDIRTDGRDRTVWCRRTLP